LFFDMSGTITALRAQKGSKERVNVYLDGEFAFGLALIHALWLRVGQSLTDDEIARLQQADTLEKAKQKAVDLIAYRPRSVKEVRQRLRRAEADDETIESVVASLQRAGLLDDAGFSQAWAESRLRASPRSRRMIAWELRQRGVSQQVIDETLAGIDDQDMACRAAAARWPRLAAVQPPEVRRRKLAEHLARLGFDYETARGAIERLERERLEGGPEAGAPEAGAPEAGAPNWADEDRIEDAETDA
jgi:regulatory protein